jgi:hypothetical protein
MDSAPSTLNQDKTNEPQAVVIRREPERELVSWKAPARAFKRRDRQFFVNVFAIAGIIGLVIFFAEGIMPVILIVSLIFLYYVLSTVPPENIEYLVTTFGIKVAGKLTPWNELEFFWLGKRLDNDVLLFETTQLPGRLELVIDQDVKEKAKREISAYIPYNEAPASKLDKLTDWLGVKLQSKKQ